MTRDRFWWVKKFQDGREDITKERHGHPATIKTDPNVKKVTEMERNDHQLSAQKIAELE